MKKISILYENMHSCKPDDYYRDIIAQPIMRKVRYFLFEILYLYKKGELICTYNKYLIFQAVSSRENEVIAEDEQAFLARQQQILLAGGGLAPTGPRSGESPIRAGGIGKASTRAGASPGLQGSPKKVITQQ